MQPIPVFLLGDSHGPRSLAGFSPWGSLRVGHDRAHTHMYCICDERKGEFNTVLISIAEYQE